MSTTSPNMGLVVPAVGVDPFPTWALDINADLSILDGHNHSSGMGVQIQPNGININTDLSFQINNAVSLRSSRYSAQSAVLTVPTDVGCVYVVGNELYYNDVTGGHNVQITSNGNVNAGAGSISGLPSGTASATFAAGTFVWQSATSTAANMDAGSYIFRNASASSKGLTLQPPAAMASNYSVTLPAIPASQSFMTVDTSGNMSGYAAIAGGITGSNIASATITGTNISSNINLPGKAVQENGNNVVVANTNATNSLALIRGVVNTDGTILSGEGFSIAKGSVGVYTITFTTAFADTPAITTLIGGANGPAIATLTAVSTTGAGIECFNRTPALQDTGFQFIACGQRA